MANTGGSWRHRPIQSQVAEQQRVDCLSTTDSDCNRCPALTTSSSMSLSSGRETAEPAAKPAILV